MQKYKMKQLIQILISHLVMQVHTNDLRQNYLLSEPKFFSKGPSHPLLLGVSREQSHVTHISHQSHVSHISHQSHVSHISHQSHVSHISHPLPGRSSMSITRQYTRPSTHNNTLITTSDTHSRPGSHRETRYYEKVPSKDNTEHLEATNKIVTMGTTMPMTDQQSARYQSPNPLHRGNYFTHLNSVVLQSESKTSAGETKEEMSTHQGRNAAMKDGEVTLLHHSINDERTTSNVIRTSTIKYPAMSNTHQHSKDHSHPVQEEMVNHQSPMLTSTGTPGPFAPRFQVPRWEISDSEWEEEIKEGFVNSGLVPGVLPSYPPGLVNINYGVHGCVHLGTHMQAVTTSTPPSRVSFPTEHSRIYSLILLDVASMSILWLVVNIPRSDIPGGQTIAEYQPPAPVQGTHSQYLMIAMLQSRVINKTSLHRYQARLCQYSPRRLFSLGYFMAQNGIEVIVAANYFTVEHDNYVDSINQYCNNT